jgi:hypothetical protein
MLLLLLLLLPRGWRGLHVCVAAQSMLLSGAAPEKVLDEGVAFDAQRLLRAQQGCDVDLQGAAAHLRGLRAGLRAGHAATGCGWHLCWEKGQRAQRGLVRLARQQLLVQIAQLGVALAQLPLGCRGPRLDLVLR